jgi:hypothetical protein
MIKQVKQCTSWMKAGTNTIRTRTSGFVIMATAQLVRRKQQEKTANNS